MYNFKEEEPLVLKFWQNKKIYQKSKKNNSKGKKFYMMDGPPYATGHIHMGTALNKILKDIAIRSKRLQGFDVFDRAGYDTHGVPIEFQIEKEIGSKNKKDIENYGVKKFILKCKEFATRFIGVMNKEFENLGVWMDFGNPYLTLDNDYIEVIWDTFKEADKKGLLYLGKYPVHACPRCETAVAYNEIEYKKQEDTSIYAKFPVKNEKNKFLIIWTTTPWTLPGNTAVMVNPEIKYSEVELKDGETWIIAEDKVKEIMSFISGISEDYKIKRVFFGKELGGLEYENPLSKNIKLNVKKGYIVILSSRYVNTEEGSGLVHCAPGHGKEDYEVGKKYGIDMPSPVEINGIMKNEAGKYSGKKARIVDSEIIVDLEKGNFLVAKRKYSHDYPFCWRCKSPLLMISMPQWFFKIDDIHKKIIKSNEKVNWLPKYMKLRMKAWLGGISDWPISRNRYWGTPLPIWVCEKCGKNEVIGSIKELEKKSIKKKRIKDVHKPEIDEIKIKCKCSGIMIRVPEVLDVWFDSGVSSWAALDYSKDKNKKYFRKFWPADLNLEGKDQVRGWWNSQIILSEIKFGRTPFDNILVHGMVLDIGKKKMSKSLGNVISPQKVIEDYGRDFLRYYFAKTSKGEDFSFDEKEFRKIRQSFITLENVISYVESVSQTSKGKSMEEDRWILSRFNSTVKEITEAYNEFNFPKVVESFEKFLLSDLSRTYIKMIRERENEKEVIGILKEINLGLLKLISPVCPFITEHFYRRIYKNKESIHLEGLPKFDKRKINRNLEICFDVLFQIIEKGLAERDKKRIGLRWPLANAHIKSSIKLSKGLQKILMNQLNLKKIELDAESKSDTEVHNISINLDIKITPELEAEGYAREISRQVQAFRKKLGLQKKDEIKLAILTDESFKKILEKNIDFIKNRTNSGKIELLLDEGNKDKEKFKNKVDFSIKDKKGGIIIVR